jgi:long-chain acyl-CoA synthetase
MSEANGSGRRSKPARRGDRKVAPLKLRATFSGKTLLFLGGTGFLGKVLWTLLLARFPDIERLVLVIRSRPGQSAHERFWHDVVTNEGLLPLREQFGDDFEDFLREKVQVVEGDIIQPFCGIAAPLRDELRGKVDVLVNASGVVDFQPPLDVALEVNAFGVRSLVELATDMGKIPILHTSTCYVAGRNTGIVEERHPLEHPFPYAGELERAHWDPEREIAECLDIIEQAKGRANDAFRQSAFLDQAKANLIEAAEPARGRVLEQEIERVRRKFVEAQLAGFGRERAQFWGWPNTYTYTKSIGEQIVARSGLPFAIVRPAIVESCVSFPMTGWNEGINTSAPLIYAIREGQPQFPGGKIRLDIIPCDMVASGMVLALAELLTGTQRPVYQFGTSDSNAVSMERVYELAGLYKRRYYRQTGRGNPVENFLQRHIEGALLAPKTFERIGPRALAQGAKQVASLLDRTPKGPFADLVRPTIGTLSAFSKKQENVANIIGQFIPFTAELDYEFRCDNTRAARARLSDEERALLHWNPEQIEWRSWFLDVHAPGLERWVFPHLENKLRKPLRPIKQHETLVEMLEELAVRHDLSIALQRTEAEGLSRYSYRDLREAALACAARLARVGVKSGDRVIIAGKNHPSWTIAFFGILCAGATAVPLDAEVDHETARRLKQASGARVAVLDVTCKERLRFLPQLNIIELNEATQPGPPLAPVAVKAADIALLIYTSGTTASPKGVMLSHHNLTSLIASLAPLFPITKDDRILSVLPLHHTFELSAGMLLPLSRGSRIVYLDELNAARLESALKQGRITAMVGVPALWEMLERKILARVAERGPAAARAFDMAVELNRALGRMTGLDAGRLLFGPVHKTLGGHLRFLVSGGAALGQSTRDLFAGVGLHLTEGYGLTEASPVLSVARAGPGAKTGHVGRPIPGVEIRVHHPNSSGVGEVYARGPNVMVGYYQDQRATELAIDSDGWLHTGDLGKLDHRGRLTIVGRAKDVIVTSNGENVYPDDVEALIGSVPGVDQLAVVGISDGRGGERVALAAVVDDTLPRAEAQQRAREALEHRFRDLPSAMRPVVVQVISGKLPRTNTRKVKRAQVREMIERMQRAGKSEADKQDNLVRRAIANVTRRAPADVHATHTLRGDLGCDSLILLELLVALESHIGRSVDADRFNDCKTVGEVEALVSELTSRGLGSRHIVEKDEPLQIPEPLRRAAMAWMAATQQGFYSQFMHTQVTGRAYIPRNRNVLVIANHTSHLDMGLVKYALGDYGDKMVSLAAQDYFFEGKWRKTFFENFSNLVPVARSGSLRQALRTASRLLTEGNVVLLFPEGTRSPNGTLQEFKPVVGYLALENEVDILPIWLDGAYAALPKGATMLRSRRLLARIGPPLEYHVLRRATERLSTTEASRKVAELARAAVQALSRSEIALPDLEAAPATLEVPAAQGLESAMRRLEERFVPGVAVSPVTYYFSLGEEKWTLKADAQRCQFERGKTVSSADCVLKTTSAMFERIAEGYEPRPSEFLAGNVKTSNVALLKLFQRLFRLSERGEASA